MGQNEITRPLSVLGDDGLPLNFGWSKQPVFFYEPSMVTSPVYKISKADRYIVHSPFYLIVFEIRDDAWLGYAHISVVSLRDKKRSSQSFNTVIPMGSFNLPASNATDSARWHRKKMRLDFINMESGAKIIKVDIPKFGRHRSMRGELVLIEPGIKPTESIVTSQMWRSEKRAFRMTRCSPWYTVEGVVQFGSTEIIFSQGRGFGIYDWYRSVRPKTDIRYWAAACGINEGRLLGFSVGYSLADFSSGTENGFFVDGRLHKLDQVSFHIPLSNRLSPWNFTSNDNRLEMTFTAHQERTDKRRFFFYYSTRRQICGYFSGKVQLDDGSIIEFQRLTGFAERSKVNF